MKNLLVVTITLILLFTLFLPGCSSGDTGSGETAGYIKVPDGPKIKVVFNGPSELEVEWEKLEFEELPVWAVSITGILTNVSNEIVDFTSIDYFVDGKQVGWTQHTFSLFKGNELSPREQCRFMNSIMYLGNFNENSKELEVRITGFESKAGSPSTSQNTAVLEEETEENLEDVVYMYVQYMFIEQNYQKVKNLLSKDSLDYFNELFPSKEALDIRYNGSFFLHH
jgi:hypothetical protein